MKLHRFYINQEIVGGKEIRIDEKELLHQWMKVFRLKASDRVVVFNGGDSEYEGYFKILSKNEAVLIIDKEIKNPRSSASSPRESAVIPRLEIFQSIIKKDNFEFIVEKCTEIGVSAFHPLISERSEKKNLNIERLNKIAKEASEQSGKTKLPEIFEPQALEKAVSEFDGELLVLDFDGEPLDVSLRCVRHSTSKGGSTKRSNPGSRIGILIGPEGGWSDNERIWFEEKGIKSFSLGPQILRAETAAIAASAIILLS